MNEQDLAQISQDAERALLGSLLLDREAIVAVAGAVPTEAFSLGRHRLIWTAATALWERREPIDLLTLAAEVRTMGVGEDRLPTAYLADLMGAAPTAVHANFYAEHVVKLARRRAVIAAGQKLVVAGYGDEDDLDASHLVSLVRDGIEPFEPSGRDATAPLDHGAEDRIDTALAVWRGEADPSLVPTGIHRLDRKLGGGFRRGQLIFLGGRPGMGKSALMIQIGLATPSHWVSIEMGREDILDRAIAQIAGVPFKIARQAVGDVKLRDRWLKAADHLRDYPVSLVSGPQTTNQIELDVARRAPSDGTKLVIIDHLGMLSDAMRANASEEEKTAKLVRRCKAIAQSCNVAVLVLAHLNRNADHRPGYVPHLSDFRYSGAIEQDADIALLLHRRRYYSALGMLDPDSDKDYYTGTNWQKTDIIIAKNRNGETGSEPLGFDGDAMIFREGLAA